MKCFSDLRKEGGAGVRKEGDEGDQREERDWEEEGREEEGCKGKREDWQQQGRGGEGYGEEEGKGGECEKV